MTDLADAPAAASAPTPTPSAAPAPTPAPSPSPSAAPADAAQPQPVPTPTAALDGTTEPDDHAGLVRSLVVGGLVGFLIVYVISFGLFAAFGGYGLAVAATVSVFVGLFGGIGFGAMVGASIRK